MSDSIDRSAKLEFLQQYDNEVIKWLKKYGKIRKAINEANKKYPVEALKLNETNVNEVATHYEYLMEHMEIMRKMGH